MKQESIGITIGKINGLNTKPFKCNEYWNWDIGFRCETPFDKILIPHVGISQAEAYATCDEIRKTFTNNSMGEGQKVAVLFSRNGIIAVGRNGRDCWIDVTDNFKVKTFKQLNIPISSLTLYFN